MVHLEFCATISSILSSKWFTQSKKSNLLAQIHQIINLSHNVDTRHYLVADAQYILHFSASIVKTLGKKLNFTSAWHQLNFTRLILFHSDYTKIKFYRLQLIFCLGCTNFSWHLLSTWSSLVEKIHLTCSSRLTRYN